MTIHDAIITAYCACAVCCGPGSPVTASGRLPVVGVTVAAPRNVPLGTWVEIRVPGAAPMVRRVEDRTHRRHDGRWDLFVHTHGRARIWGKRVGTITVIRK